MITDFPTILFIVFCACVAVQLFYYFFFFARISARKLQKPKLFNEPVSVIICARNEEQNLKDNLPLFLEQDYANYEVVVVNDGSWDDSDLVLEALRQQYKHLHVVFLPNSEQLARGKKIAVTLGIKGAENDLLVFSDADCKPMSKQWLQHMVEGFAKQKDIVLGYSPYRKLPGLLNKFIRFDAFVIGMQYLSYAMAGLPYMGVGRNLAYRRQTYESVSGFKSHYHIPSGDDDLFINQVANRSNTAVQYHADAQVKTMPQTTWKELWRQKKRHYTTARHYKFAHKILLTLLPLSSSLLIISFVILLFMKFLLTWILSLLLIRCVSQIVIFRLSMNKLGDKDLVYYLPLLELMMLVISPAIYLAQIFSKQKQWK